MKIYKSTGTYTAGNKEMISVINDEDQPTHELIKSLKNKIVKIDDKFYQVKAIETFATLICHKGQPIGLMVQEIKTHEKINNNWMIKAIKDAGLNPNDIKTIPLDEFINNLPIHTTGEPSERMKRLFYAYTSTKPSNKAPKE